jgi:hypothetical protein
MIACARHFTIKADGTRTIDPVYLTNCEKICKIIAELTRDHSCWTYVEPAQRTCDGQMAYLVLYQHILLGPNNVDNMAMMAEDKLKSTVYNGEQRYWDIEWYINVHMPQLLIMEGLAEHGYTGIDQCSKVRYLLDGIDTDRFDSVKTQITSDATLQTAFNTCVTLYQDFIKQNAKAKSSTVHDDAVLCDTMRANISTVRSASAGPQLTPQILATNWGIDVRTAARTVQATTQRGIQAVHHPMLSRRSRTNDRQL